MDRNKMSNNQFDAAFEGNTLLSGISDDLEQAEMISERIGISNAGRYASMVLMYLKIAKHFAEDMVNRIDQEKRQDASDPSEN